METEQTTIEQPAEPVPGQTTLEPDPPIEPPATEPTADTPGPGAPEQPAEELPAEDPQAV